MVSPVRQTGEIKEHYKHPHKIKKDYKNREEVLAEKLKKHESIGSIQHHLSEALFRIGKAFSELKYAFYPKLEKLHSKEKKVVSELNKKFGPSSIDLVNKQTELSNELSRVNKQLNDYKSSTVSATGSYSVVAKQRQMKLEKQITNLENQLRYLGSKIEKTSTLKMELEEIQSEINEINQGFLSKKKEINKIQREADLILQDLNKAHQAKQKISSVTQNRVEALVKEVIIFERDIEKTAKQYPDLREKIDLINKDLHEAQLIIEHFKLSVEFKNLDQIQKHELDKKGYGDHEKVTEISARESQVKKRIKKLDEELVPKAQRIKTLSDTKDTLIPVVRRRLACSFAPENFHHATSNPLIKKYMDAYSLWAQNPESTSATKALLAASEEINRVVMKVRSDVQTHPLVGKAKLIQCESPHLKDIEAQVKMLIEMDKNINQGLESLKKLDDVALKLEKLKGEEKKIADIRKLNAPKNIKGETTALDFNRALNNLSKEVESIKTMPNVNLRKRLAKLKEAHEKLQSLATEEDYQILMTKYPKLKKKTERIFMSLRLQDVGYRAEIEQQEIAPLQKNVDKYVNKIADAFSFDLKGQKTTLIFGPTNDRLPATKKIIQALFNWGDSPLGYNQITNLKEGLLNIFIANDLHQTVNAKGEAVEVVDTLAKKFHKNRGTLYATMDDLIKDALSLEEHSKLYELYNAKKKILEMMQYADSSNVREQMEKLITKLNSDIENSQPKIY